ncbi:MAG: hypothetical protein HGA56_06350 [Chlorobiaceae bacterium]|nr:hypothetical protein [Chlorobiaceae bacterium]
MTPEEFQALLDPAVLALVEVHAADDPSAFALRYHGRKDLPVRAMAEQVACRQRAARKLPSLSRHPLLYTTVALEQASGERAAGWKAGLMSGRSVIDLTGGLGIDSMFFARRFERVVYCERDGTLARLAAFNFRALGISNIETRIGESRQMLAATPDDAYDWIYVDPARREAGRRSVGLESTSPDVVALHDLMLSKAPRVCVKASPALEITGLQEKLPELSEIVVVSVGGECKEILLLLVRGRIAGTPPSVRAVCLGDGEFGIASSPGAGAGRIVAARSGRWLYEPDGAIIKARLSGELAAGLGLEFLNHTVDYLTSDRLVDHFPGRIFSVDACLPFKPKKFREELARRGVTGAAIQRRDFPLSPEQLRKQLRLAESSDRYLFFTRDASGELVGLICRRSAGV